MSTQRESRYVAIARIAYHLARQVLPKYTHPKSPHHFEFPQLAACVLLMFYLNVSYRDMEEWLLASGEVRDVLGLKRVPDHTTLHRAYKKLRQADLERMKERLLAEVGEEEGAIAVDSTGFAPCQASWYYQSRSGKRYTGWWKGVYAVGTASQYILAWHSARGPGSDAPFLTRLKRGCRRFGKRTPQGRRAWLLLADAGFDGTSLSPLDLIPPIRRHGTLAAPQRKARADLVSAARLDGLYGQRWKAETVHSVIKRKFGDRIRSRSVRLQHREVCIKGLVYDIHR